jgi:hypothetical protein
MLIPPGRLLVDWKTLPAGTRQESLKFARTTVVEVPEGG